MSSGGVFWDAPESKRQFANMLAEIGDETRIRDLLAKRNYDSATLAASISAVEDLTDRLVAFALDHATLKRENHATRLERRDNVAKIMIFLRDYAFALLKLKSDGETGRFRRAQKEVDSGRYISEHTGVRYPSVGEILDLKGRNEDKDAGAQMLFEVCRNPEYFMIFESFVKGRSQTSSDMRPEALAARLLTLAGELISRSFPK